VRERIVCIVYRSEGYGLCFLFWSLSNWWLFGFLAVVLNGFIGTLLLRSLSEI